MMVIAAVAMTTSCKDDDDSISAEDAVKYLVSGNWQGYGIEQRKQIGGFVDTDDRTWNIVRFERAATNAFNGTGCQLGVSNEYMSGTPEMSNFRWSLEGNIITIAYEKWGTATFNFKEMTINNDKFSGFIYQNDNLRYQINYNKRSFADWDKYKN